MALSAKVEAEAVRLGAKRRKVSWKEREVRGLKLSDVLRDFLYFFDWPEGKSFVVDNLDMPYFSGINFSDELVAGEDVAEWIPDCKDEDLVIFGRCEDGILIAVHNEKRVDDPLLMFIDGVNREDMGGDSLRLSEFLAALKSEKRPAKPKKKKSKDRMSVAVEFTCRCRSGAALGFRIAPK